MEKGKVKSFSGQSTGGTIADGDGRIIVFNSSNVVGKDRGNLQAGDYVWFERVGMNTDATAINIRKC